MHVQIGTFCDSLTTILSFGTAHCVILIDRITAMAENLCVFRVGSEGEQNDTGSREVIFEFESAEFHDRLRAANEPAAAQMDSRESERDIRNRPKGRASSNRARNEAGRGEYLELGCFA
jgi:hypothetical protein